MATIKGQNLRIALNGKCISASQSCTLHVQMTAQDKSTKDSENDWVENEIVGAQWDVSADALVTDGIIDGGTVKCTKNIAIGKYVYPQIYKLNAGDKVTLMTAASDATIYVFSGSTILAQATTAGISYTATEAINISIGCSSNAYNVTFEIIDKSGMTVEDLMNIMNAKTPVTVTFGTTLGNNNRVEDQRIMSGTAVISDIQIQTPNRQDSTCSVQLTGTGELEFIEEEP